jgi:hypothetical protein
MQAHNEGFAFGQLSIGIPEYVLPEADRLSTFQSYFHEISIFINILSTPG